MTLTATRGARTLNLYDRYVIPQLVHLAMRQRMFLPFRQRIAAAAEGDVLEIGVGSGLNLPLYGPGVRSVIGIEPSPALLRMARRRRAAAPVTLLQASAEAMPVDDNGVDTIVMTWTLCSIADAGRALGEMRRVLRPGGRLLFVEHGRAPQQRIAWWQDALDPVWTRFAGGCHLNRRIDALIADAGFRIEAMSHPQLRGPSTHTFLYEGSARPQR